MGSGDMLEAWLRGTPLADLGEDAEPRVRRELVELQGHVVDLERRHRASLESDQQIHALLGQWSKEAERASLCFGEYDKDLSEIDRERWRGYLAGYGEMARVYGRALQTLGNVVRARSLADERGEL